MSIETGTEISKAQDGEMKHPTSESTSESAAELKAYLAQMKGKSPKEVMGEVAESSLVYGMTVSTFLVAAVLAAFTLGPYYLLPPTVNEQAASQDASEDANADQSSNNTATANAKTKSKTNTPDSPTGNANSQVATQNPAIPSGADVKQASKELGIDQTKTADPKSNPLENSLDTLLDGLE